VLTALVLAGLLTHQSPAVRDPEITLRLHPPAMLTTGAEHGDPSVQLEALESRATSSGRRRPIEMSVVVVAYRAGDVWVDRNALRLELRRLDGAPIRSGCRVEPDNFEPRPRDEVRLRAGQTMKITLTVGHSAAGRRAAVCFGPSPEAGRRLGVVAVYDPADAYPFRMRPRNGATHLTRHVESNLVALESLDAR
jgi:hypothetical protein